MTFAELLRLADSLRKQLADALLPLGYEVSAGAPPLLDALGVEVSFYCHPGRPGAGVTYRFDLTSAALLHRSPEQLARQVDEFAAAIVARIAGKDVPPGLPGGG